LSAKAPYISQIPYTECTKKISQLWSATTQHWSTFIREFENCRQTCSYHSKATNGNANKQTHKM